MTKERSSEISTVVEKKLMKNIISDHRPGPITEGGISNNAPGGNFAGYDTVFIIVIMMIIIVRGGFKQAIVDVCRVAMARV